MFPRLPTHNVSPPLSDYDLDDVFTGNVIGITIVAAYNPTIFGEDVFRQGSVLHFTVICVLNKSHSITPLSAHVLRE